MTTYEICGTCSINCSDSETEIFLIPANGYLSPCKGFAVLYPVDSSPNALLKEMTKLDGSDKLFGVELSIAKSATLFSVISQAAATQRKIKLTVEEIKDTLKVVRCLFPAP